MIFKKKKMTDCQKATIQRSNCQSCGFRVPLDRNMPVTCLWGIMDTFDIQACNGKARCDRYISDIALEKHFKQLMKLINKGE